VESPLSPEERYNSPHFHFPEPINRSYFLFHLREFIRRGEYGHKRDFTGCGSGKSGDMVK